MAIRTKEEILNAIKDKVEDTDSLVEIFEDISDTFDNFENKDMEDWKAKYEENDKMWKEKYINRFLNNEVEENIEDTSSEEVVEEVAPKTYDDLFKTEGE